MVKIMITKESLIKFKEEIENLFNQRQITYLIHLYNGSQQP